MNTLGIIGALLVSYSNLPQMWLFIKNGNAKGISASSTWLALLGLGLRTIYLAKATSFDPIALGPYVFAIACVILTLRYIHFPKDLPQFPEIPVEMDKADTYELYLADLFDRGSQ